jgi:hypothetical protein
VPRTASGSARAGPARPRARIGRVVRDGRAPTRARRPIDRKRSATARGESGERLSISAERSGAKTILDAGPSRGGAARSSVRVLQSPAPKRTASHRSPTGALLRWTSTNSPSAVRPASEAGKVAASLTTSRSPGSKSDGKLVRRCRRRRVPGPSGPRARSPWREAAESPRDRYRREPEGGSSPREDLRTESRRDVVGTPRATPGSAVPGAASRCIRVSISPTSDVTGTALPLPSTFRRPDPSECARARPWRRTVTPPSASYAVVAGIGPIVDVDDESRQPRWEHRSQGSRASGGNGPHRASPRGRRPSNAASSVSAEGLERGPAQRLLAFVHEDVGRTRAARRRSPRCAPPDSGGRDVGPIARAPLHPPRGPLQATLSTAAPTPVPRDEDEPRPRTTPMGLFAASAAPSPALAPVRRIVVPRSVT